MGADKRNKSAARRFTSNVIPSLVVATDLACLIVSVVIALCLQALLLGDAINGDVHVAGMVIAAITFFLIRSSRGAYAHPLMPMRQGDSGVAMDYLLAALLAGAIVWQFGHVTDFSRALTLIYVVTTVSTLFLSRFALRALLGRMARNGRIAQRVVLYGADPEVVERTCRLLELQALPQLSLIGVTDDREVPEGAHSLPFLGGIPELIEKVRAGEVDQVLVALTNSTRERLDHIFEQLSSVAVDISLIPREAIDLFPDYRVTFIGEVPALTLRQRPLRDFGNIFKDAEDFIIAALAVIVFSPVLLITAIAIRLTSPGPILFVQSRFGFNNQEIRVFKFRSMYVDRGDVSGAARTVRNDDRVTPVGKVIRALSIDELPQLFNVLRGEMSVVGPRPHATHMMVGDRYYFDVVSGYAARHRVKPGITGLAQVRGLRGEIQTIERAKRRVELDMYYIDNWSLMLDLRVLLETVVRVLMDDNAY